MEKLAGRERNDGVECWVAVTTEAFSQALLSEKPLTEDGAYVPQKHAYLQNTAGRIWAAMRDTLKPFIGKQFKCFCWHCAYAWIKHLCRILAWGLIDW